MPDPVDLTYTDGVSTLSAGTFNALVTEINAAFSSVEAAVSTHRYLAGCMPNRDPSGTALLVQSGSLRGASNNGLIVNPSTLTINLATTGLNGLDTGTIAANTWYYVYMLLNPTTGQIGAVASTADTYTPVVYPSGFTVRRKLPWAGRTDGSAVLRSYRIFNWPGTQLNWVLRETEGATNRVLLGGSATSATSVALQDHVPPGSQMGTVYGRLRYVSGPGGHLFVRTPSGLGGGNAVAYVNSVNPTVAIPAMQLQTNSTRNIEYWVTDSGIAADLYVGAYFWNEPT